MLMVLSETFWDAGGGSAGTGIESLDANRGSDAGPAGAPSDIDADS